MVDLEASHLVVDWLCLKIVDGVNKEFAVEAETEKIVLEVVLVDGVDEVDGFDGVDGVDRVDESDEVEKHKGIALS